MNKQIRLTMPEPMFYFAKQQSKKEGHRSVQEYVLQLVREQAIREERYKLLESFRGITKEKKMTKAQKLTHLKEFEKMTKAQKLAHLKEFENMDRSNIFRMYDLERSKQK